MLDMKEVDVEAQEDKNKNPALQRRRAEPESFWAFLRKGWFWGGLLAIIAVSVVTPLALRAQHQLKEVGLPTSTLGAQHLSGPFGGSGSPWGEGDSSDGPTCGDLAAELPADTLSGGFPPPVLRTDGPQIVSGQDGAKVALHGITWSGFDRGVSFVSGLNAQEKASWEGSDFATVVQRLRLLGFNTVRLPFTFEDLQSSPQDVTRPCPGQPPKASSLAEQAINPQNRPQGKLPAPPQLYAPPGLDAVMNNSTDSNGSSSNSSDGGAMCNSYVPSGPTTLARLLWTVDYLVRSGFYVVLDYQPPAPASFAAQQQQGGSTAGGGSGGSAAVDGSGPAELDDPEAFAAAWRRLGVALTCLPSWRRDLAGRVMVDLLSTPDAFSMGWQGGGGKSGSRAHLGEYYLAAMDELNAASHGKLLFVVQGGGQATRMGLTPGDGFVAGQQWAADLGVEDAGVFFDAVARRPYRGSVLLAPHFYATNTTRQPDGLGAKQWGAYSNSWGVLQTKGFCNGTAAANASSPEAGCMVLPVVAGDIGGNPEDPQDVTYYNNAALFFSKKGLAANYTSAPVTSWVWGSYTDDGASGGLVEGDAATIRWSRLQWLQDKLGLRPWYQQHSDPTSSSDADGNPDSSSSSTSSSSSVGSSGKGGS